MEENHIKTEESKHLKKMIAPIVITCIVMVYLVLYIVIVWMVAIPRWIQISGLIFLLILIGVSVGMLAERIKEIRSGEEDDLSNY